MPLLTSDRMSASTSDLFTGSEPPGPLLPDLHGVLNDLVEQLGIVTQCSDKPLAGGGCRLLPVPLECPPRFGDGGINGFEMSAMHFCENILFYVGG
jgi:hypothetical protein